MNFPVTLQVIWSHVCIFRESIMYFNLINEKEIINKKEKLPSAEPPLFCHILPHQINTIKNHRQFKRRKRAKLVDA